MGNLGTGTVLNGRYQIQSVMGGNALGITYECTDTASGGRVAIRELFPQGLCSRAQDDTEVVGNEAFAEKKAQFVRQMQILSRNRGLEGIVDVHVVFEEHGTAYCVMEYVEGVSLEKYLSESGRQFPLKRMKELTKPIVESLSVLHKEGLIHRNISPDNLIFTNQGNLKLIGFGCMEGQVSDAGTGYVPVELYRRQQECSPAADIYSLCASIYRCITGVIPQDAYARLNDDQLREPSQLGIGIDSGDETVLMMGLNIYEEKRFRTMDAFRNAFFRSQEPPAAKVQPSAQPVQAAPPQPVPAVQTPVQPAPVPAAVQTPVQPVPPAAVQQQPENVGMIIQTTAATSDTGKKKQKEPKQPKQPKEPKPPKQKKGGSGGMIAIAAVGGLLIIGLGISAFMLGKDMLPGTNANQKPKALAGKEKDEEESTERESGEEKSEKTDTGSVYEEMLAAGNYSGALEGILALDTGDMKAEEKDILSDILSRAIAGQYTEFENRINENQGTGAFDSALAAVDEELALYDRLAANSMAAQYVNRQQVEDKKTTIKQAHMNYLLGAGLDAVVSQGSEDELDNLIASLQEYVNNGMMSQEDFDKKKTSAHAKFVLEKIVAMNNAGTAPVEIITYINENLYDTGNNCHVLEYWDYFRAVMGQGAGDPNTVHPASPTGYLLPDSNSRNLSTSDLSSLSRDALRLAIYEIFARHGRTFQDQAVNNYFSAFSWYQQSSAYDESALNEYEKFNLNLLIEYQKTKGYR